MKKPPIVALNVTIGGFTNWSASILLALFASEAMQAQWREDTLKIK